MKDMYFDKLNKTFICIREMKKDMIICAASKYYSDAQTTISTFPLSDKYFKDNCERVYDISKYAKMTDHGSWRVV